MLTSHLARAGAAAFGLWGAMHVAGGAMILAALRSGPDAGFAVYRGAEAGAPAVAGAVLGYFAYILVAAGLAVAVIAMLANSRNRASGLMATTLIVLVAEIGLVAFLVWPGYVAVIEALPGLVLFGLGAVLGGIACREAGHAPA